MKPIDGGTKRLARETVASWEGVADALSQQLTRCPTGYTFWRAKAQRGSHGRRVELTVVFASLAWIAAGAQERADRRRT